MSTFYNDNDPFACEWLRNLIAAGHLPAGDVVCKDIRELRGEDVEGYERVSLFAGIGGWDYALELAGWPKGRSIWTASCPCPPFSAAGRKYCPNCHRSRLGFVGWDEFGCPECDYRDPRHLWPSLRNLIRECRPDTIVGEQVASNNGRGWLARVQVDLQELGFAFGAQDSCAASVAAPHIRQRLFWVANAVRVNSRERRIAGGQEGARRQYGHDDDGRASWLGSPSQPGLEGHAGNVNAGDQPRRFGKDAARSIAETGCADPWSDFTVVACGDGKTRRIPTEPSLFPLASGVPGRVGQLRAAGNAIVPKAAAIFIRAFLEAEAEINLTK